MEAQSVVTDNRWDRARKLRNLEDKPITSDFYYWGNIQVDWETIYNDLKDPNLWSDETWAQTNWRIKEFQSEPPFPVTSSTAGIDLSRPQTLSTKGTSSIDDDYPPIKHILDTLGVYLPDEYRNINKQYYQACRINRQMPGQLFLMHYDFSADDSWDHYFVFLNDWSPGQVSLLGTEAITNWKSGDVYWVQSLMTPHGSANCGYGERWLATIKGKKKTIDNV